MDISYRIPYYTTDYLLNPEIHVVVFFSSDTVDGRNPAPPGMYKIN